MSGSHGVDGNRGCAEAPRVGEYVLPEMDVFTLLAVCAACGVGVLRLFVWVVGGVVWGADFCCFLFDACLLFVQVVVCDRPLLRFTPPGVRASALC